MVCLHGKVIVFIALKMFSLRSQFNIHNEVSFKIRHFKNILPFSSIPITISEGKWQEKIHQGFPHSHSIHLVRPGDLTCI